MIHNPCLLGGPQKRGQNQSTKKNKKNIKKISIVSLFLPRFLQIEMITRISLSGFWSHKHNTNSGGRAVTTQI